MDETGEAVVPPRAIAGFWRRLVAFAIDCILVGVAGVLLGWFFFDTFARMGEAARLVGLAIAWPYFGLLNSRLAGGQTAGKWLLGIHVVDRNGAPLDVSESMLRALVLLTPWLLNGIELSPSRLGFVFGSVLAVIVFGGLGALVYLYLFNRRTRQLLHDLVVGSYVVRDEVDITALPTVWKPHLWIVAGLCVAAACLPLGILPLLQRQPFAGLMPAYQAVAALPGVQSAGVQRGFHKVMGGDRTDWVTVTVRRKVPRVDDQDFAQQVAQLVMDKYPASREQDQLFVVLTYGYNIGIASSWRTHQFNFPMR
ncbi:RDD family protein [Lysobacter sp. M15]|uniref:RDD family protein n=1 Tax=Lysobacter sp. M15 TaxID=2916837 RepID=UPI001F56D72F|nr:RDD family protein [Lysobacter sp. M15]